MSQPELLTCTDRRVARYPRPRRAALLLAVTVIIGGGAGIWQGILKDRLVAKRWGVVEEGRIYRSGQISRHLIEPMLTQNGIRVVIDLTGDDPANPDQPAERQAIARLGIELKRCPLWGDGTGNIRNYAAAVKALVDARREGKPVLVHCFAGTQRTGGVVAAYRMLVEQRPPGDALAELRKYKWDPTRDGILTDYLNAHMAELAALLVANGVLAHVPDPLPTLVP